MGIFDRMGKVISSNVNSMLDKAEDDKKLLELNLEEMAGGFAERLIRIFARNAQEQRPVYGGAKKFQDDPHWRDLILFHEYFHGDTGQGLGASHQTGWTALIASVLDEWRR